MKYVTAYTFGFGAMFAIGLANPTPALTDGILLGGSHFGGLCISCVLWLASATNQVNARLRQFRP